MKNVLVQQISRGKSAIYQLVECGRISFYSIYQISLRPVNIDSLKAPKYKW